jgi:hypothetical protein
VNEHLEQALGVTAKRKTAMSAGMLRAGARLLRPFNQVLARQLQLGALLDSQPQVVDSGAAWRRFGLTPTTLGEWLDWHLPALAAEWGVAARPGGRHGVETSAREDG